MVCVRFVPDMRFWRYALRSVHACCLPPVRQTERLAECFVPIPPWVVIAIRTFSRVIRLSGLVGSLRVCTFLYGDPDGEREDGETRGTESAARQSAFLCKRVGFAMFSAGSTLGQNAEAALRPRPKPAPKSH